MLNSFSTGQLNCMYQFLNISLSIYISVMFFMSNVSFTNRKLKNGSRTLQNLSEYLTCQHLRN